MIGPRWSATYQMRAFGDESNGIHWQQLTCSVPNPKYENVTLNRNRVKYFCVDGRGCLMRRPFVPCILGFRNSYLGLEIIHLSFFFGLGKGTDLRCYDCIDGRGFVSTAQFQECAEVLCNFEIRFLFQNWFAISQFLIYAGQFRNCTYLLIARNIYMYMKLHICISVFWCLYL